jgi:WD40 repeat protein
LKVWDLTPFKDLYPDPASIAAAAPIDVKNASMTVMAHQKYINVTRVSPNDKLIASSSQDRTIKIWNAGDLMLL